MKKDKKLMGFFKDVELDDVVPNQKQKNTIKTIKKQSTKTSLK